MSKSLAYRHYQRALAQWPVDLLRPEVSFQKAMQRRIDRRLAAPTQQLQTPRAAEDSLTPTPSPAALDEKAELEQVNVLYSFLENRYTKKVASAVAGYLIKAYEGSGQYPLSPHIMKPLSNPEYYATLLTELHEAPKRSWFGAMINKWKGYIRFS